MPRPPFLAILLLPLTFVGGLILGVHLGGTTEILGHSEKNAAAAPGGFFTDAATQERVEANTAYSARIRELNDELEKAQQAAKTAQAERVAFFKKHHDELYLNSLEGTKVSPMMTEVLGLTPEEKSAVEKHLADTQAAMQKLYEANTTLSKQTDNSVVYTVAKDPKGKELRDQLQQSITDEIGPDRADLLMSYGQFNQFSSPFHDFGADQEDLTIGWTVKDGKPLYTWRDSFTNGSATWNDKPGDYVPDYMKKFMPEVQQDAASAGTPTAAANSPAPSAP